MEAYPGAYLYRRLVNAKLYIDRSYAEPIDLNQIAGEAYCSKFHFIRLFRKVYGKTPHQYLIAVRLEHARQVLRTGASIADACIGVGFESLGSFSSLFKKKHGETPAAWQRRQSKLASDQQKRPLNHIPGCFGLPHVPAVSSISKQAQGIGV